MPEIVLTDFYTKACRYCREEALILEELSEVFAGQVEFRMVDAERGEELVERWNGFVSGDRLERALRVVLGRE
ncbi:MAG: hypothetical protein APR56_06255 [Methanosaeta sp. SDB]|uniref:Thioredoxin n=1 Tax=Methanothrix harundinacea TaxID=301375 RepID=A0A101IH54_9EURY|nr:MAG: hypothetical protein APR56_06255 [Methanosaeta sp. SDB]KUK95063.1 MAG: Thioredoxin [Methanothrix harundinacea]